MAAPPPNFQGQNQPPPPPPMRAPSHPNCPPGMEYLIGTDGVMVNQHMEMLEILTGYETNNRYDILDMNGIRMYFAVETTDFLSRQFLRGERNFTIVILDNSGVPALLLQRSFEPGCGCTGNIMRILTPDCTSTVGEVVEENCCRSDFSLRDGSGNVVLNIQGPSRMCLMGEASFDVVDLSNQPVGEIHKHWRGYIQEAYSNADTFGVSFPLELDPQLKCILLGAVFLIDFMFYEQSGGGGHHHHHHGYGYGGGYGGYGGGGYGHHW